MPTPAPDFRVHALAARATDSTTTSPPSTAPSTTSETPFFPSPTGSDCDSCNAEDNKSLEFTKNAVEGALIVVAIALILAITTWRMVRLRRHNRPLRHFFRVHSHPHSPSSTHLPTGRPSSVPRTTGLPPAPAPPASVIYDTLVAPVPLAHHPRRERGRARRTRAADVDGRGRRGAIRHPEDGEELPEYDDKDVLPRYQDVEAGLVPGPGATAAARPGPGPGPGAAMHAAAAAETRREEPGQMVGVGTLMLGRSPNRDGGTSDTDPLVTRTVAMSGSGPDAEAEMGAATSEDGDHHDQCHAYPPPMSSAGSHEGYGDPRMHD
ncbi:hypothetical protein PYCCODRAFT_1424446 [Trametes coccinea BRFM310]|uniref:Uncharacterized protein n=1 Tax=Trametes coccinea (strain BRFM310) TaxID=1353009 RepID=A0A1Y2IT01_TRAC3|nr:hypothetical protein PYCCODRAFT_1424446 [Trametes coccinea BRFM310]